MIFQIIIFTYYFNIVKKKNVISLDVSKVGLLNRAMNEYA